MNDETELQILSEAAGAHAASRQVLALMETEGGPDPLLLIIRLLTDLQESQRGMMVKLATLETRLGQLLKPTEPVAPPD